MLRVPILASLLAFGATCNGQGGEPDAFTLYRESSARPFTVKKGKALTVHLIDTTLAFGSGVVSRHAYTGLLDGLTPDTITLINGSESVYYMSETVRRSVEIEHHLMDSSWTQRIPTRYIGSITYPMRVPEYGAYLGGLSLITAVFVAPLVSMNYRRGTFDGEKYLDIVTPCLIGGGVALLLNAGGPERRLVLRPMRR